MSGSTGIASMLEIDGYANGERIDGVRDATVSSRKKIPGRRRSDPGLHTGHKRRGPGWSIKQPRIGN
jgi:hypothetical protein